MTTFDRWQQIFVSQFGGRQGSMGRRPGLPSLELAIADRISSLLDKTPSTSQPIQTSLPQHAVPSSQAEPVGVVLQGTTLRSFNLTSPRLDTRFKDMMVKYNNSLYDYIAKRKKRHGTILVKLKYLGLDSQNIEPYIVIQCEKKIARTVEKFFAQEHVKEDILPDFRILVLDKPPIEVANDDTIDVLSDSFPDKTMCGMPITLSGSGKSVSCTLGGVIIVETDQKRMYGLIAGHPLKRIRTDCFTKQPMDQVYEPSSPEESDSDATSTNTSAMPSSVHPDMEKTNDDHLLRTKANIGTVVSDTFSISSEKNYDWALIDLNQEYALPNLCSNVMIRNRQSQVSDSKDCEGEICLYHDDSTDTTTVKRVLVLKQDKPRMAKMSLNTSSLIVSPGSVFVNAHDVIMKGGSSFSPGDSGLWVVDANTLGLYGHVVSVDAFGEAQVMPIQSTLQSIKKQLKATRVSLATSLAVDQLKFAPNEPSTSTLLRRTATEGVKPILGPSVRPEEDSLQDKRDTKGPRWSIARLGRFFGSALSKWRSAETDDKR